MADVFQRHELKYLVTAGQRAALEQELALHMTPDVHGESTICNVYYDTPDFLLIRRSLEKPEYKEKLRIRSYGQVKDGEDVFLELKKKFDGIVYKRRITVDPDETEARLACGEPLDNRSQIGREIEAFRACYSGLGPRVYLCYDRTAWFESAGTDDNGIRRAPGDLRLTFDKNIRYRTTGLSLRSIPCGKNILAPRESLLEIKAANAIPMWLVHTLSRLEIRQTSFSKYGRAYCDIQQNKIRYYDGGISHDQLTVRRIG